MSKSGLVILLGIVLCFITYPVIGLVVIFFGLFGVFVNCAGSAESSQKPNLGFWL